MNILVVVMLKKPCVSGLIFLFLLLSFPALFRGFENHDFFHKNKFFYVQPTWNHRKLSESEKFYEMSRVFDQLALQGQRCKYIVIPESGFAHNLFAWRNHLDAWSSLFDDDVTIFLGAHRYDGDKKYNSFCALRDGKIIYWYDKCHLVFFVERRPSLFAYVPLLGNLFIHHDAFFNYPDQQCDEFEGFQVYICSELFYEAKKPVGKPILFICNDAWLSCWYMKELACRTAQLYSMRSGVPLFYAGFSFFQMY